MYIKLSKEVSIPIAQKVTIIITNGYNICTIKVDKNLPKKYAVGENILFANSLSITGACKGTYKMTVLLALYVKVLAS